MTVPSDALGLFACRPASDGPAPAPQWCGRRWSARSTRLEEMARAPASSTSAAAPAASPSAWPSWVTGSPSSTPAPTPWPPSAAGPARWAWTSPVSRATCPTCPRLVDEDADVVLCHGVLEVVDDPAAALATIREVLRPGGTLSLLVAQRHAAVIARAMAGHFPQALALLADASEPGTPDRAPVHRATRPPRSSPAPASRSSRPTASGSSPTWSPAPCSTSSPVPPRPWSSSSEPSPERSEYLPLATQLHLLAR